MPSTTKPNSHPMHWSDVRKEPMASMANLPSFSHFTLSKLTPSIPTCQTKNYPSKHWDNFFSILRTWRWWRRGRRRLWWWKRRLFRNRLLFFYHNLFTHFFSLLFLGIARWRGFCFPKNTINTLIDQFFLLAKIPNNKYNHQESQYHHAGNERPIHWLNTHILRLC